MVKRVIKPEMVDNLPKIFDVYKKHGVFKPRPAALPDWAQGCHPEFFKITTRLIVKECMQPVDGGSKSEYTRLGLQDHHFMSLVTNKFSLYSFAIHAPLGLNRRDLAAIRKIKPADFETSERGMAFRRWFINQFRFCFECICQKLSSV